MFKYRVHEICRKLNRMEPPSNLKFNIDKFPIQEDAMFHISKEQLKQIEIIAFESGYKQAVKEMKQYFGIKETEYMKLKRGKFYFEDKQEQERFLKELQNRWQKLVDTCKGLNNANN